MKILKYVAFLLAFNSTLSLAEIAVVVHPSNNNTLSNTDISRLFLGKKKVFPDGATALPISQTETSEIAETFAKAALSKSPSQLKAYWSKQIFTGKGTPPDQMESDTQVKEVVAKNPSAIGFIDSAAVDSSVKVVATF
jgi:ABC-type phosphate transport system substrate-binding protein